MTSKADIMAATNPIFFCGDIGRATPVRIVLCQGAGGLVSDGSSASFGNQSRLVKFVSLPDAGGKREAQQQLARIITELDTGAFVEPSRVTVAQFLERWLNHIKTQVADSTYDRYGQIIRNNLIPALGDVRLAKLRPEHISDAYSKALVNGRSDLRGGGGLDPQTVGHMHTLLKQALKQACVWRAINQNPAALVKPPKVSRKEMHTVDADATVRMIEAARATSIFIPVLLGVLCGLRRGEICALRWRSIDLDAGRLSVVASARPDHGERREKETKTGKRARGHTVANACDRATAASSRTGAAPIEVGRSPDR